MDDQQVTAKVGTIAKFVDAQMERQKMPAEHRAHAAAGIELVGELLLDLKRIASTDRPPVHLHFHCPEGSVLSAIGDAVRIEPWLPPEHDSASSIARVARLLASKEALRKIGGPQLNDSETAARREAWVNGNWQAFQDEAAEILAAVIPGAKT